MFYPNHHIRTYCLYLGSFEIGETKLDFGAYQHNENVSHAIVFGNEDSEYMSGEFIFEGKLLEEQFRFKNLYCQINEKLYQEYLKDPDSFLQPKKVNSMKIVINKCYGGFSLSEKAILRYAQLKNVTLYRNASNPVEFYTSPTYDEDSYFCHYDIPRTSPALIQTIEELGQLANSSTSNLKIITIPDDIDYSINNYDGIETIVEKHRIWS